MGDMGPYSSVGTRSPVGQAGPGQGPRQSQGPGPHIGDPNTLSKDGTVAMKHATVSDDGKLVAYQLSASGSDWVDIKVRDVATGKDLPDLVKWVKFSGVAWRKDGSGFFYSRYDAPKKGEKLRQANYFHKLYWHKVGTAQQDDVLIYERKDHKNWGFGGGVTDDDRYLIIHVWRGAQPRNQVFIKDLRKPKKKVVELLTGFDNEYDFIGNDKTTFYFKTDRGAGAKGSADEGAAGCPIWVHAASVPPAPGVLQGGHVVPGLVHRLDVPHRSPGPRPGPGPGPVCLQLLHALPCRRRRSPGRALAHRRHRRPRR